MKKFFKFAKAVILKAATLILLPALAIFNWILKVFTSIFRFLALPIVVFGMIILIATYFDNGYSQNLLQNAGLFTGMGVLYFLLPLCPPVIDRTKIRMKSYAFAPIIVRSPVKFTL